MRNHDISGKAGGTIGPALFIKLDTSADEQFLQAGAGDPIIGITIPAQKRTPGLAGSDTTVAYESGDDCWAAGMGNSAMLTIGGTITRGDRLKSDASGRGITASSGDQAGAIALQSATVGLQVKVLVVLGKA